MNLTLILKFLPYASRLAKAATTIERLEKDPDVQDILKLVEELGALVAKDATATGTTNAKTSIGNTGGGPIG